MYYNNTPKPKRHFQTFLGYLLTIIFLIVGIIHLIYNFTLLKLIIYISLIFFFFIIATLGKIKQEDNFYKALILEKRINKVEEIAKITDNTTEEVKDDLDMLLDDNKLPKVGINFETGEIRIFTTQIEANLFTTKYDYDDDEALYLCNYCGARNYDDAYPCQECGNNRFTRK